ncbi:hypothetical protein D3C86_1666390 [compost metagenome]
MAAGDHRLDGRAVLAQPARLVGNLEVLVHHVAAGQFVIGRRDQDRVQLEDLRLHVREAGGLLMDAWYVIVDSRGKIDI